MKTCANCGCVMNDEDKFCRFCGGPANLKPDTPKENFVPQNGWYKNEDGVWVNNGSAGSNPNTSYGNGAGTYSTSGQPGGNGPVNYQNGPQNPYQPTPTASEPTSMWQWVLTIFLASLPVAGLVLLIIWSFSADTDPEKKNWARANLILSLIITVVMIVVTLLVGVSIFTAVGHWY
ncbi:MAG: hypothetical protein Q4B73_05035 [Lachnospiraceae bacterium]|nr:hypothetical protein [Lachnospiraceae bacterium]